MGIEFVRKIHAQNEMWAAFGGKSNSVTSKLLHGVDQTI
jgi:hypothetical protein